ncbi:unnamed protein product [Clavelina lepadiformis]|uniref:4-hydroxy-2-oxoglutarate aldolase, mitochondrial n=1 Tax=Clavelina lepadiformis TaxID=159417 RepID=A0ABP0GHH0_CLALP
MRFKSMFLNTNVRLCVLRYAGRHFSSSSSRLSKLGGIYPPIPTPFSSSGSVAYDKLKENLNVWNNHDFAGYIVQGSNGEYPYLTNSERVEVVYKVKESIAEHKMLIAGSGCESTSATIEMSNAMAKAGADAVLVVTPSFYKNQMLSNALYEHYIAVADKCNVPVILYNVPGNTGINIPIDTVADLSSHPNIIGIKDSGGDISRIGLIVHETKSSESFQVLAGSAGFLLASYAVGAVGGVCALANVLGNEVCELHRLCLAGRWKEAKALQHRLIAPNAAVTAKYGVPGLKAAMDWFGLHGGQPRSPLQPLNELDKRSVRKSFEENGFL